MSRRMPGAPVVILLLALFGCDEFSLPGQFKNLDLALEKTVVRPGETCVLTPLGGFPPYTAAASAGSLYDSGAPADCGAIQDMVYTAGLSIGTVKIALSDSAGHSMETLITVLPWAPQNLIADGTVSGSQTVDLNWFYTTPGHISGFKLLRSKNGGAFDIIATPADVDRSFADNNASPQMNVYRLYAVAGDYESSYAEASALGNASP